MKLMFQLLFFQAHKKGISFTNKHLYLGVVITWLVGVGRYWNSQNASLVQYLGLGSVIYIFIFSLAVWIISAPFKDQFLSYKNILTFVSLTSAPAILYAIPIERFFSLEESAKINVYFLLTVALWRVALLLYFYLKFTNLRFSKSFVCTFLPLTGIVSALTVLNLERAVFNIMSGLREVTQTSNDQAYANLVFITSLSLITFIPFLLFYLFLIYRDKNKKVEH
jgi:hypothetical protein